MAQIPMGRFGNRVAQPGPVTQVRTGDPLAEATNRTLGVATDVATENQAMQTRLDLQAADEAERQAKEAKAAADRVKQLIAMQDAEVQLDTLADEVGNGILDRTLDRDKAEQDYTAKASKVIDGAGADLDPTIRPLIQAQLRGKMLASGGRIRDAAVKRDRADVSAGISQVAEYAQRLYKTDPQKATQQFMQTVDMLGPHSDMSPAQLQALKQRFVEGNQYTAGYEAINAGRYDRKALDAAENFIQTGLPDLDPQKKAELLKTASAYRSAIDSREMAEAERRSREAERIEARAARAAEAFQRQVELGGPIAPEYIEQAMAQTRGTMYSANIVALANQARETGGFATQPADVRAQQIAAIDRRIATEGRTPQLTEMRDRLARIDANVREKFKEDGLSAALSVGAITDIPPLNLAGGLPELVQGIQARVPAAEAASLVARKPVSPLTAQEADIFAAQLNALPIEDRAAMIEGFARTMPPAQAQALAAQISPKDKALGYAFALIDAKTTQGRSAAVLALRGAQAKKDGTSTKGEKQPDLAVNRWSAEITELLGGAYPDTVTEQLRDAAILVSHGIASEQGGELSKKDRERAVSMVIQADLVEFNGRKTPIPKGWDVEDFRAVMSRFTPGHVGGDTVTAAGRQVPTADFLKTLPTLPLMPVSKGSYAPLFGGRPVLRADGTPLVLKVN